MLGVLGALQKLVPVQDIDFVEQGVAVVGEVGAGGEPLSTLLRGERVALGVGRRVPESEKRKENNREGLGWGTPAK